MVRRTWLGSLAWCAAVMAGCGGGDDAPQSCIVVAPTQATGPLFAPADPPVPLVQVSGASPFAPGCGP